MKWWRRSPVVTTGDPLNLIDTTTADMIAATADMIATWQRTNRFTCAACNDLCRECRATS